MSSNGQRLRLAVVASILVVALFAIGGVTHESLLITLGALAVGVAVVMGRHAAAPALPRAARRFSLILWAASSCAALQMVPLPRAVVGLLSPRAVAIRDAAATLLGAPPPAWLPITLDVPGTAFATATAIAVAVAFDLCAHAIAKGPGGVSKMGAVLAIVVLAFAVAAILHALTGAEKLFGVYRPREALPSQTLMPSLLNPNHAAAVACVAPPLFLALAIHSSRPPTRIACLTAAILTSAVAVLTLSRGGMAVLAAEVLAVVVYGLARAFRKKRGSVASVAVGAVVIVGAIAVVVAHVASDAFVREASNTDLSKIDQAARSYSVLRDFSRVGVGRGAFESVFPAYEMPLKGHARVTNPEHWPAQLLTEFGVPLTVAGLVVLVSVARVRMRTPPRHPVQIGAMIAVGGLIVHDLADFALEYAGAGMLAAALMAIVLLDDSRSRAEETKHRAVQVRAAAGLAVAGALVFATHKQLNSDEVNAIADAWRGKRTDEATLTAAIRRHPGEPFYPLVAAARLEDSNAAAKWFLHAIKLAPNRAQSHFWFARWLVATNRRPQAWAEYAASLQLAPPYAAAIARDLVAVRAPVDDIIAITRLPLAREIMSRELTLAGRDAEAARIDQATATEYPPAIDARLREVYRAKQSGDLEAARRLAEAVAAAAPNEPRAHLALADTAPTADDAEATVEKAIGALGDRPELLETLVRLRGARLGLEAIPTEIDRLRAALVLRDGNPHRLAALLGDLEVGRGRLAAAVRHYQDAASISSDPTAYLERAAALAERGGYLPTAIECLRRLVELHPERPRYSEDLKRVTSKQAAAILVPATSP